MGLKGLIIKLFIACVLLLCAISTHAKPTRYFFDKIQFPVPRGKIIQKIVIGQSDHIWLTMMGDYIHRYNGKGNVSSYSFGIDLVKIDSLGRVWEVLYGQESRSLTYFDTGSGTEGTVSLYDKKNNLLEIGGTYLLGVFMDTLYFVEKSGVLYSTKLPETLGKSLIFKVETRFNPVLFTQSPNIRPELEVDGNNHVWLSLGSTILRYDLALKKISDFSFLVKKNILNNRGIITTAKQGSYTWLNIHYTGELFRIDSNDQVHSFFIPHRINDIEFDKLRNILWIATENGIFFVEGDSEVVEHHTPEPWQKAGLASSSIFSLSFDKNNNLWVTSSDGVQLIRGIHQHIKRVTPELSRGGSVIDARPQVVQSLVAENRYILWWINRVNELVRYDVRTGNEQVFSIVPPLSAPLRGEPQSIVYSKPYILISTSSGYLLKFNTETKQFHSPIKLEIKLESFYIEPYYYGGKWFNYMHSILVNRKDKKSAIRYEFKRWNSAADKLESIFCETNDKSFYLMPEHAYFTDLFLYTDTFWIVNKVMGVDYIFKASADLSYCEKFSVPDEGSEVFGISQVDPETIWLIQGRYVRQLNVKTKQVLYEQLLPMQAIDHVETDRDSNFLVYGDNALWRYNIFQKNWQPLFSSEVDQDTKSGITPFFDKKTGVFYILSHQGIVLIDTLKEVTIPLPQLSFTSIKIGEEKQTIFASADEIEIPYAQAVEIGFTSIPILPSQLLRFRYRLAKNQPWVIANKQEKLLFTLLPHGSYKLEMQATVSHQDFGNSEYLQFTILPPWWHTKIAYVVYFSFFTLLCSLLIFWNRTRKQLREAKANELMQQQKRLSALGMLAGGIVHDFNNALFVILGSIELIELKDKDKFYSQYIESILAVISDTKKMTDKLLSFAKKGGTNYVVVDMHNLIDDAVDMTEQTIKHNIQLKKNYAASCHYIECDDSEMRNALINIMRNACQAITGDKGIVEISTTNRRHVNGEVDGEGNLLPEQSLVISIVDNGSGIPKTIIDHIFEPFVTTRNDSGGTGLGLSVVYGTIKEHSGNINIKSKLNLGTQVTLFFPVTTTAIETVVTTTDNRSINFDNKCILLCEDNKQLQMIVKEMLNNLGITVLLANNGQQCLDIVKTGRYSIDLIILDDIMPVMGGRECFYELKMGNPIVPVIMITGYRENTETEQLLKDGLLGVYKKPIAFEELVKILTKIFS